MTNFLFANPIYIIPDSAVFDWARVYVYLLMLDAQVLTGQFFRVIA